MHRSQSMLFQNHQRLSLLRNRALDAGEGVAVAVAGGRWASTFSVISLQ